MPCPSQKPSTTSRGRGRVGLAPVSGLLIDSSKVPIRETFAYLLLLLQLKNCASGVGRNKVKRTYHSVQLRKTE